MSSGYFTTSEAEKVKNWDMLQQHRECKARLSRLENELKLIANSWKEMAGFFYDWRFNTFAVDDTKIRVLHRAPNADRPSEVGSLALTAIDIELLRRLLVDLEDTKKTLADLSDQVEALGIQA